LLVVRPRPLVQLGWGVAAFTPAAYQTSYLLAVLLLADEKAHLEAGFPLRCFQRLSLRDLATRQCHFVTTDTPAVAPTRSSRTRVSSPQPSCAHTG